MLAGLGNFAKSRYTVGSMSYRLLALDLDGTLLRSDQQVDAADIAAIRELQRAGVTVTILTGRLQSGALGAAAACKIEGAIGCAEGSHIVELASNTTLAHHPMELEVRRVLRDTVGAHGLASFVFDSQGIHHDHLGAPYAGYVRTWSPNVRVVEEELAWQTEPIAAVAIGAREQVEAAHGVLRAHADRLFSVSFAVSQHPGLHAILVRASGPTKGTALRYLCDLAGCEPSQAVVVGDWHNDVPMFEIAGRSFSMRNSPSEVIARSTDKLGTEAGAGGGVAEAIRVAWDS